MSRPRTRGWLAKLVATAGVMAIVLVTPGDAGIGALSSPAAKYPPDSAGAHRGFALPDYSRDGYQSPTAHQYLRQLVAVGATWVQIDPTWYQEHNRASSIAPRSWTPSDAAVERVIAAAHELGLKVLLKPLLDLLPDGSAYRGTIRPADRAAWFRSYSAFIGHYADLAARQHAEELAVGTELAGVSGDRPRWLEVVASVRARYPGTLLYAANFDEFHRVAFWDALDLVGIDAYWKLSDHPTSDVAALRRAWKPIVRDLASFAARGGHRILFTEAGYTSQRGATTAPWSWTTSTSSDEAEQAAGYEALLASLSGQSWWAGVFWWCWDVPSAPDGPDPLGYSSHAKAAEAVVRRWWPVASSRGPQRPCPPPGQLQTPPQRGCAKAAERTAPR